jgi:hypothetical protein
MKEQKRIADGGLRIVKSRSFKALRQRPCSVSGTEAVVLRLLPADYPPSAIRYPLATHG